MEEYLIDEESLQQIARAVRDKAGITDDMTPKEIMEQIYLLETPTDVGAPAHGVFFYDYDGTLLYSYTVKEARALTALPDPPTHDGLPSAGWTHTLEEVKSTLKYLDVGAMYDPPSTKIVMDISDDNTTITLRLKAYGTSDDGAAPSTIINWGDGTTQTISNPEMHNSEIGIYSHTYATSGTYTIEFVIESGTLYLGQYRATMLITGDNYDSVRKMVKSVIIAKNTYIGQCAFRDCDNLESIIVGLGIKWITSEDLYSTGNLKFVVLPTSVTGLRSCAFQYCDVLTKVIMPAVQYINEWAFYGCENLERIIIPSSIASIGDKAFYNNDNLREIHVRSKTPPSFGDEVFGFTLSNTIISRRIYVPQESVDLYKTTTGWSSYRGIITGEPV